MAKCACYPQCQNDAEPCLIPSNSPNAKFGDYENISPGMDDYCNEPCTNERHDLPPFHPRSASLHSDLTT